MLFPWFHLQTLDGLVFTVIFLFGLKTGKQKNLLIKEKICDVFNSTKTLSNMSLFRGSLF